MRVFAGGSAIVLVAALLTAQSPQPPTFRTGTDVVLIDVSVLDDGRRPVRGLTAADFVVREDGKVRPVVAVDEVVVPDAPPARGGWTVEIAPDTGTNQVPEARLFVIVLDDALVPHDPRIAESVRITALAILDRLTPADRAAVVFTSGAAQAQGFTADRSRLTAAVQAFTPRGAAGGNAVYIRSARTLANVCDFLANVSGPRKTVFYVSPGMPVDLKDPAPGHERAQVLDEIQKVFPRADRANVTIHAIDPTGNSGGAPPVADARERTAPLLSGSVRQDLLRQDVLGAFSASTGGRLVVRTDGFTRAVESIFGEHGSYYLVGFQSASSRHDGKFRRIDVRVPRRDVTVLARGGYFATETGVPDKPAATSLDTAVNGWSPEPGVPLLVAAAPFASSDRRTAAVAVVLGVRHVRSGRTPQPAGKAQVLLRAFTPDGVEAASARVNADIALRPSAERSVYYEVLARLDLPPGRYLLRMAAEIDRQSRTGSVFHEITVPDFEAAPLSMSGVILATVPELHAAPRGTFAGLLPLVPTANRQFPRNIRVTAFGRVYQTRGTAPRPVSVTARILDASGAEVVALSPTLPVDSPDDRGTPYSFDVPVATLKPGEYLLTVQSSAGAATDTRHVRFQID
jgi:VWFA-related protein